MAFEIKGGKIDIADLIKVRLIEPKPGFIQAMFECVDRTKNVVFDEKALAKLNEILADKVKGMEARDPKVHTYIEEFLMRMVSELYKNGLVDIVEAKDSEEDPYAFARKLYGKF
jgi:hypothetical protein